MIQMKRITFLVMLIGLVAGMGVGKPAQAGNETTVAEGMAQYVPCAGSPATRLNAGLTARVTPGLPNALRSQPFRGSGSAIIGQIPGGSSFVVVFGPICGSNLTWWQVNYNGVIGWTPEGEGGTYWVEPINVVSCPYAPAPRLTVGGQGRVTPGLPNTIRSQPNTSGARIGQIPGSSTFSVLSGPVCGSNLNWWQVNYNGVIGWTAEGQYSTYWVEPVSVSTCTIALPPRLTVGRSARVTWGGSSNNMRSQPNLTAQRIGQIPPGGIFSVIEGPQCNGGIGWWKVNYNGVIGWTAEGLNNVYWLEPQ